ncbi:NUDIX domain-containing protein [Agromyces mediolanus]|uniref:NUDIX hydrolase n=1 Tax=Agromyces mediolanus TaxID=41986 RepID=UPI00383605D0
MVHEAEGTEPGSAPSALPDLLVAAIALVRDRRVLMVTARGREVHYMPGGKIDPGETAAEAAAREAREEVSLELDPAELEELFEVVTQAHGEPEGRMVRMRVFLTETDASPRASAEVGALHWVTTADLDRCPPAGAEVLRRLAADGLID